MLKRTLSQLKFNSVRRHSNRPFRVEHDSLGEVKVDRDRLWGAQTQRSLENFDICREAERMPLEVVRAVAMIKKAAAITNVKSGLDSLKSKSIQIAAQEIIDKKWDEEFPLSVFQTGSGTQTNMNVNEVISNRGTQIFHEKGGKGKLHPNDDVNMSQSSNDTIPTAMHISVCLLVSNELIPSLRELKSVLEKKEIEFERVVKIGRTHMMDATPLTLGQEFSAFRKMADNGIERVKTTLKRSLQLAQGATAVGTGLNTDSDFQKSFLKQIKIITKTDFTAADNLFESISSHDAMVEVSGALNTIACSLMKMANDIRLLSSGPRCGLGELVLPANEPGSSIMPGKVNPTQCEALSMACAQVMGNHTAVTVACSNGHLQLNAFKPVIISNVIRSIKLLSAAVRSMTRNCVKGIKPNEKMIKMHLKNSLMLVTALNKKIGYEKAANCALKAHREDKTLEEAALELKFLSKEEFDESVDPNKMLGPRKK